ncbi:hypothetical protein Hdeb2414_s0004g00121501 [Helianthus debilis subsp. tardiflorus]
MRFVNKDFCVKLHYSTTFAMNLDKGLKKPLFTSARLKKGEVLYLESPTHRFELCFNGEKMVKSGNETDTYGVDSDNNNNNNNNKSNNNMMDVFRWSLCKKPLPQTLMCSISIPLPPEHLKESAPGP